MTSIENENIRLLTEKINEQNDKIDRIEAALLGDKFNQEHGLINRVKVVEDWKASEEIKNVKERTYQWIIGAGVIGLIELLYKMPSIISLFKK